MDCNSGQGSPAGEQATSRRPAFMQRLVLWMFGMTVLGQLYTWPLALFLATRSLVLAAIILVYVAYILGPGYHWAEHDGWPHPLRNWSAWRLMAAYFPARLVKTADLPPTGRFVFACYPHGITAISAWINFGTDATGFSRLFPGITNHCMTLSSNFRAPLVREWCLLHGLRSCSRRSCLNMLQRPGNSILLVPGGAAEALIAHPGEYRVIIKKRRGFVRVALMTGASLVPVIMFGEPELFDTKLYERGTWQWRLQQQLHHLMGSSQPVFWGTGLFGRSGLLPYPRPLTSVVGAPLAVERVPKDAAQGPAFDALVEETHTRFHAALLELWAAHKALAPPGAELKAVA